MGRGEENGMAKLTEEIVKAIRADYKRGGVSQRELAVKYGISQPTVSHVVTGYVWGHVKGAVEPLTDHTVGRMQRALTDNEARAIRLEYQLGNVTQAQLAERYGVVQSQISNIILRKTYKHV